MTDTRTEAVAALVRLLDDLLLYDGAGEVSDLPEQAAETIRALVAERDALLAAPRAEAAVVAAARAAALQEAAEAVSRATYTIPVQPGLTPAEAEERAVWMVSDQAADIIAALAALSTPTPEARA